MRTLDILYTSYNYGFYMNFQKNGHMQMMDLKKSLTKGHCLWRGKHLWSPRVQKWTKGPTIHLLLQWYLKHKIAEKYQKVDPKLATEIQLTLLQPLLHSYRKKIILFQEPSYPRKDLKEDQKVTWAMDLKVERSI